MSRAEIPRSQGSATEPRVAVVTPIHNGIDLTVRMLESLEKLTYPHFDVVIVDLGSEDGSREMIRTRFPEAILVEATSDMWWSAGTNAGVREALRRGCEYVFTLNNDVVLDPNALSASVTCAQEHPAALVGSKVYFMEEPTRVWFFGQRLDRASGDVVTVSGRDEEFVTVQAVDMLTGMGMLIPSEVFERIGLFDEEAFPQYFGDSDFSLRARSVGYELVVTPESKLYNDLSSSWPARGLSRGRVVFLGQLVCSRRSPFHLGVRRMFYRRYWGPGYRRALARLYITVVRNYLPALLKNKWTRWRQRVRLVDR